MKRLHLSTAIVRIAAIAIILATIPVTRNAVPASAHATVPPIDPNCATNDETPNDASITINRTGYWVIDSVSPDASYANRSNPCARYWKVGIYNARARTVKILATWGQDKFIGDQPNLRYVPSEEAKCVHTIVSYYVWGLAYGSGYTPLGGGDLFGVWIPQPTTANPTGGTCTWKGDNPFTTQRETTPDFIRVSNSPYDYFIVRAEAYDHFSNCPTPFHCNWAVRVRLYAYPVGYTLGPALGEAGADEQQDPQFELVPVGSAPIESAPVEFAPSEIPAGATS
jgi:hypothetical protein